MAATAPIYQRLAAHDLEAIRRGGLQAGDRFPSVRLLMQRHDVSLSTALRVCRHLEDQGWLQARPRSQGFADAATPSAPAQSSSAFANSRASKV